MNILGNRLKLLREENGFTLEYVANHLKTTKTSISRYEKNYREPKYETLSYLADFYDVSTDYLLGRSNERNSKTEKTKLDERSSISPHKISDIDNLSDEAIEKINRYIEMIKLKYNK